MVSFKNKGEIGLQSRPIEASCGSEAASKVSLGTTSLDGARYQHTNHRGMFIFSLLIEGGRGLRQSTISVDLTRPASMRFSLGVATGAPPPPLTALSYSNTSFKSTTYCSQLRPFSFVPCEGYIFGITSTRRTRWCTLYLYFYLTDSTEQAVHAGLQ